MATKQTKSRRSSGLSNAQPSSYSELYGNRAAGAEAPVATPARPTKPREETPAPQRTSDSVDWAKEYGQVLGDVRQLLIISAALFALMIVLGFVL